MNGKNTDVCFRMISHKAKKFDFEKLSKADQDSSMVKRFKKFIGDSLFMDLGNKDFEFVKPIRDSGVSYYEGGILSSQIVDDEKITVLPIRFPRDCKYHTFTVSMKDSYDREEMDQIAGDWMNMNGDRYQIMSYHGLNLGFIDDSEKKKVYNVSTEVNGQDVFLESFSQKPKAHRFADEYLLNNGTPVTVSCVETQVKKVRQGSPHQLEMTVVDVFGEDMVGYEFGVIFNEKKVKRF